jgi:multiple sugar transport system permease protein
MRSKEVYTKRDLRDSYLFTVPLVLFALAFVVLPVVGTVVSSLFRDVAFLSKRFIGWGNYHKLLLDPHFWQSFRFTFLFVIVSVGLELVLGMTFALVLNESFRARGIPRVAILIPWAIPVAISARVWQLMYNYDYGIFNYMSVKLGISPAPVNWLGSSAGAFASLVLADAWKTTPFVTIILLAVDGTSFGQRFFKITLPLLKPVVVVALLFRTIDALRIFDLVYVLTGGGPGGSTSSLSLYAYKFFLAGDFGYGSVVSVIIFMIASGLAVLYIRLGRFKEVLR